MGTWKREKPMPQKATTIPKPSVNAISRQAYAKLNVLVIEDAGHMSGLICGILKSLGVGRISEARSGRDALDIMNFQAVDLVVTDDLGPPMDGLAVAREIRKSKSPEISTIPIIHITSKLQKSAIFAARDAGVTEVLSKPFSATQMIARIESALANPRPIIKAQGFVGPDRRRKIKDSTERRRSADKTIVSDA